MRWGPTLPHLELVKIARTLDQFQFPKKITIEVTAECNLECAMCHQSSMRRPKGAMPFDLWRKCADEIAQVSPRDRMLVFGQRGAAPGTSAALSNDLLREIGGSPGSVSQHQRDVVDARSG